MRTAPGPGRGQVTPREPRAPPQGLLSVLHKKRASGAAKGAPWTLPSALPQRARGPAAPRAHTHTQTHTRTHTTASHWPPGPAMRVLRQLALQIGSAAARRARPSRPASSLDTPLLSGLGRGRRAAAEAGCGAASFENRGFSGRTGSSLVSPE